MLNIDLYKAISDFAGKFGRVKFNDDENLTAYQDLVDKCVKTGKIPEANRREYSTHGQLYAAIAYETNRIAFCGVDHD